MGFKICYWNTTIYKHILEKALETVKCIDIPLDYLARHETIKKLHDEFISENDNIVLTCLSMAGYDGEVEVTGNATISHLKTRIAKMGGLNISSIRIVYQNTILDIFNNLDEPIHRYIKRNDLYIDVVKQ